MKRKSKILAAVLFPAALVAGLVFFLSNGEVTSEKSLPLKEEKVSRGRGIARKTERIRKAPSAKNAAKPKISTKKNAAKKHLRVIVEDTWTPEEHKLADAVQTALNDDDFAKTKKAAAAAMMSTNSEVRLDAVNALGWFGDKALVDLTKALSDKDPDVAEAARGQVEQALSGMEDPHAAFVFASEYAKLFGENPETTTMFLGIMEMAATQFVDPDNADSAEDVAAAKARRADIVTALSEMIALGGTTAASAKETYESIVGEDWSGPEAANAWANDVAEPEADAAEFAND